MPFELAQKCIPNLHLVAGWACDASELIAAHAFRNTRTRARPHTSKPSVACQPHLQPQSQPLLLLRNFFRNAALAHI